MSALVNLVAGLGTSTGGASKGSGSGSGAELLDFNGLAPLSLIILLAPFAPRNAILAPDFTNGNNTPALATPVCISSVPN